MSDLAATAERLRVVKRAHEHFLARWAVEMLLGAPAAVDQFHADIHYAGHLEPLFFRQLALDD